MLLTGSVMDKLQNNARKHHCSRDTSEAIPKSSLLAESGMTQSSKHGTKEPLSRKSAKVKERCSKPVSGTHQRIQQIPRKWCPDERLKPTPSARADGEYDWSLNELSKAKQLLPLDLYKVP